MSESKAASLVLLKPASEIIFQGPFTDVVTAQLHIENPQNQPVCFKVKTTAPKQYCVRPNSGIVNSGETATVAVMLQPMESIPPDAAKHKFMVQSTFAPSGDTDLDTFWKNVNPSELSYGKLRVVFDQRAHNEAKVESPASVNYFTSPEKSRLHSPNNTLPSEITGDTDAKLRVEQDRVRKLEAELDKAHQERAVLIRKVAALNSGASRAGDGELGLPMVQVALICIAGILLGLIVGKLF